MKLHSLFLCFVSVLLSACRAQSGSETNAAWSSPNLALRTQKVVIYKTIRDFSTLVPVLMTADRSRIVSYPAPADVREGKQLLTPISLKKGYLLDRRGINANVVFLKYTYQAYAERAEAPSLSEMMANIEEKYPLEELYDCGSVTKYPAGISDLNKLIDNGFPDCAKADITVLKVSF